MSLDAAATLSLKIDTGTAAAELSALHRSYELLKDGFKGNFPTTGMAGMEKAVLQVGADIKDLTDLVQKSSKSMKLFGDGSGAVAMSLSAKWKEGRIAVREVVEGVTQDQAVALAKQQAQQKVSAAEQLALEAQVTQERRSQLALRLQSEIAQAKEAASAQLALEAQVTQERKSQLALRLQSEIAQAKEAAAAQLALEAQVTQERRAQLMLRLQYEIAQVKEAADLQAAVHAQTGAILLAKQEERWAAEKAMSKAHIAAILEDQKRSADLQAAIHAQTGAILLQQQEQRWAAEKAMNDAHIAALLENQRRQEKIAADTLAMERRYILASQEQRLKAAIDARKLMDAGYGGNLKQEFAPGILNMANANSLGALQKQLAALKPSIQGATGAQIHWNQVGNEAHALARGLSGSLGTLWMTYGSIAPLLAGATIAGSMVQVMKVGKDLEYQLTFISAITGDTAISMREFGEAVQGSMFAPEEAAKGLRALAQSGLSSREALEALPSVLKLATVGETDMATAAKASTSIMHTFGLSVNDFGHIGDVFSKAAAISATSVTEMMEAMKQAAAISNVFGVSMEETAASLATLANRGIEGSAAGTAIRNMIKEMASPATEKAANAMKQFGINVFNADGTIKPFSENLRQLAAVTSTMTDKAKANFLEDLFNERGAKAANILLTDLEKMSKSLEEIKLSSQGLGFTTEAQIAISQSAVGMLAAVKSEWQLMLGEVFTAVEPQVKSIIVSLAELVKSEGLQSILTGLASAVVGLTEVLFKYGDALQVIATATAAVFGIGVLTKLAAAATPVLAQMTVAAAALASGLGVGGLATAVGAGTGGAAGAVALFGAALTSGIVLTAGAAIAAVGFLTYEALRLSDADAEAVKSIEDFAAAQRRLNDTMEQGFNKLLDENKMLEVQIRLMKEGKSAAEALNIAKAQAPVVDAAAKLAEAEKKVAEVRARAGKDSIYGPSFAEKRAIEEAEAAFEKAQEQVLRAQQLRMSISASGARNSSGKEWIDQQTKIQNLNKSLSEMVSRGADAEKALKKVFEGSEPVKAAQKTFQQGLVNAAKEAKGISPLSADASLAEIAQRESLMSTLSTQYSRITKPAKKAGSGAAHSDAPRNLLEDARAAAAMADEQLRAATVGEAANKNRLKFEHELQKEMDAGKKITQQYKDDVLALADAADASAEKMKDLAKEKKLADGQVKLRKAELDLDQSFGKQNSGLRETLFGDDRTQSQRLYAKAEEDAANAAIDAIQKAEAVKQSGGATEAQYAAEVAKVSEKLRDQLAAAKTLITTSDELNASWEYGAKQSLKKYLESVKNVAAQSEQAMTRAFQGMEDALVKFAQTGKLDFKSLADSILADITRIEIRQSITGPLAQGMKTGDFSGLFGGFGKSFGFGGGGGGDFGGFGSSFGSASSGPLVDSGGFWAKGAVFNTPSLHSYVNTVHDSPRFFATHAKGNVFAEAGPEAVMPLTRDSQGRLGVRAGGQEAPAPNYNVTVNVPPGTPAETRRAAGQGAREALSALSGARRYG